MAEATQERKLLGVACKRWFGLAWRGKWTWSCMGHASWGMGHHLAVLCLLLCLEKLPQCLNVILELGRQCLTNFVDFFDNGVVPHTLTFEFFWSTNDRRDIARLTTDLFDTTP